MTRRALVTLLLLFLASCAPHQTSLPAASASSEVYLLPLHVANDARVCAQTVDRVALCRSVGEFRLWLASLRAGL